MNNKKNLESKRSINKSICIIEFFLEDNFTLVLSGNLKLKNEDNKIVSNYNIKQYLKFEIRIPG